MHTVAAPTSRHRPFQTLLTHCHATLRGWSGTREPDRLHLRRGSHAGPDGWQRDMGRVALLCLYIYVYWCNLFPNILTFPVCQKSEWGKKKTQSANIYNKQQDSHKCHLVAIKMETIRCATGSDVWTSAEGSLDKPHPTAKEENKSKECAWNAGKFSAILSKRSNVIRNFMI